MIWVVGGGPKSYQICQLLKQLKRTYKLTTITDYQRDMPLSYTSKALCKPLSEAEMISFVEKEKIQLVIDHSYGAGSTVSKGLIKVCEMQHISYIRYEVPTYLDQMAHVKTITALEEVADALVAYKLPIFLDVNRKVKKEIAALNMTNCMYKDEVDKCQLDSLEALFKAHHICCVLAGESESVPSYGEVCCKLEIPLIVIKKDKIKYPMRCTDLIQIKERIAKL